MGSEWSEVTLSDICLEVRYGYTASATEWPTGTRFLRVSDITSGALNWETVPFCKIADSDFERYELRDGDIVIARMGTIGVSALIRKPVRAVAASYLIRHRIDDTRADPQFVSYVLRSPAYWTFVWSHGGSGAVQPNINAKVLGQFSFTLPPLVEQRAIAHILGTLDDKIELNRRMSETLEAMARALFKSWFVDFDPVRAKAEGRDLGLPKHIADLFPDSFVHSELGAIPKGWTVTTLSNICEKPQYGYTASASSERIGPNFLRIADINKRDWIEWENVPFCSIEPSQQVKYALSPGDIVIARTADPGHGALIEEPIEAVFASYLIRFRPKRPELARGLNSEVQLV